MDLIVPFLGNLRGGEQDVIRWPAERRHRQIDEFIEKLRRVRG